MDKKLLATALVLAGFATGVAAQEGAPPQAPGAAQQGPGAPPAGAAATEEEELAVLPEFKAVDANEDGMIQENETEALAKVLEEDHRIEFQFDVVDENRDGQINNAEYVAYDAMLAERLGIA